jgi:lysyl-tRNA synthetase class 2
MARGAIKRSLRAWFEGQGFVETEISALAVSPGNEAHLHAFATEAVTLEGARATLYLHTSPEFAAKKLLAAGETQIFEFARVWRNRERGPLHSPEFTMLEWYRSAAPYETLMDDCAALLRLAAQATGALTFAFRGGTCDPFAEPERPRAPAGARGRGGALRGGDHPGHGRADRPGQRRATRSPASSCPARPSCWKAPARWPTRSATRPTARSRGSSTAIPTACC